MASNFVRTKVRKLGAIYFPFHYLLTSAANKRQFKHNCLTSLLSILLSRVLNRHLSMTKFVICKTPLVKILSIHNW